MKRANGPPPSAAVVAGWTATAFVDGRHAGGQWGEVVHAAHRLHRALAPLPRPPIIDTFNHQWARADRMVWEEAELTRTAPFDGQILQLLAVVQPLEPLREQLVHGDLAGNVLVSEGLAPAILDFSPYWRPPGYALAQLAVDAMLWWEGRRRRRPAFRRRPAAPAPRAGRPVQAAVPGRVDGPPRHRSHRRAGCSPGRHRPGVRPRQERCLSGFRRYERSLIE